jgi:hypothetical protein
VSNVVGMEQTKEDTHLIVYDVRTSEPVVDFEDAHADDITQVISARP